MVLRPGGIGAYGGDEFMLILYQFLAKNAKGLATNILGIPFLFVHPTWGAGGNTLTKHLFFLAKDAENAKVFTTQAHRTHSFFLLCVS